MPSRRVRPRLIVVSEGQKRAQQAWNQGLVGKGRPAAATAAVEPCTVEGCGTPATGQAPAARMVQVAGSADGAPAHWYCPGRCAVIARTRAELRAIPLRPGGER
jgi:hypothetical protein